MDATFTVYKLLEFSTCGSYQKDTSNEVLHFKYR